MICEKCGTHKYEIENENCRECYILKKIKKLNKELDEHEIYIKKLIKCECGCKILEEKLKKHIKSLIHSDRLKILKELKENSIVDKNGILLNHFMIKMKLKKVIS